jgi:hypothetical protein
LPDFRDTALKSQRYVETNFISGDDLAVRNGVSFFDAFDILEKTPGTFRLSYPHQLTVIDLVSLRFQYLVWRSQSSMNSVVAMLRSPLKLPLGTLLPYFMEDSEHAYVIVP